MKRLGGTIEPAAVTQLATNIGPDLWAMSNVVAQLVAAAGGKPISVAQVGDWSAVPLDDNIFHFTDALSARNARLALELLQSQLHLGVHPLVLHTMLSRHVRTLVSVQDLLQRGIPASTIAAEVNVHPFVAQKASFAVQKFQPGQLTQLYLDLITSDADMKTGKVDPELALVHFVARVCIGSA